MPRAPPPRNTATRTTMSRCTRRASQRVAAFTRWGQRQNGTLSRTCAVCRVDHYTHHWKSVSRIRTRICASWSPLTRSATPRPGSHRQRLPNRPIQLTVQWTRMTRGACHPDAMRHHARLSKQSTPGMLARARANLAGRWKSKCRKPSPALAGQWPFACQNNRVAHSRVGYVF